MGVSSKLKDKTFRQWLWLSVCISVAVYFIYLAKFCFTIADQAMQVIIATAPHTTYDAICYQQEGRSTVFGFISLASAAIGCTAIIGACVFAAKLRKTYRLRGTRRYIKGEKLFDNTAAQD